MFYFLKYFFFILFYFVSHILDYPLKWYVVWGGGKKDFRDFSSFLSISVFFLFSDKTIFVFVLYAALILEPLYTATEMFGVAAVTGADHEKRK